MTFAQFKKYYYIKKTLGKGSEEELDENEKNGMQGFMQSHTSLNNNFRELAKCLGIDISKYIDKDNKSVGTYYIIPDEEVDYLCDALHNYNSKISKYLRGKKEQYSYPEMKSDLMDMYNVSTEEELFEIANKNTYLHDLLIKINYNLHRRYFLFCKEIIEVYRKKLPTMKFPELSANEANRFSIIFASVLKNVLIMWDRVLEEYKDIQSSKFVDNLNYEDDEEIEDDTTSYSDYEENMNDIYNIEKMFREAVHDYCKGKSLLDFFSDCLSDDSELFNTKDNKWDNELYENVDLWFKQIEE